ncbi:SesA protein, partial [Lepidopterella palustris CBS 459.81]
INNITSTLDTTAEVYANIKDGEDLPQAFHEVAKKVELVVGTLRIAKTHILKSTPDEKSCKEIKPTVERCKEKASRLENIFHQVVPQASTPRPERYRLAVTALGKGNRVETLMKGMLEDVKLLAGNQAVKAATEAEIGKLVKAIEELVAMPPSLSEDTPGNSINNYGSGTVNANTGEGTQNNNTGSGKQFNGQYQYFGKNNWHLLKQFGASPLLTQYRRFLQSLGPC